MHESVHVIIHLLLDHPTNSAMTWLSHDVSMKAVKILPVRMHRHSSLTDWRVSYMLQLLFASPSCFGVVERKRVV